MHGRTSSIYHDESGVYQSIPSPFSVCRYHSLVVDPSTRPQELRITSRTEDGVVMGLQHRQAPIIGVQFHPESILTEHGFQLLANFLQLAGLTANALAESQPERLRSLALPRQLPTTPVTF